MELTCDIARQNVSETNTSNQKGTIADSGNTCTSDHQLRG